MRCARRSPRVRPPTAFVSTSGLTALAPDRLDWLDVEAEKLLLAVLRGTADANVAFGDLRYLLERLGFQKRIRGSHHIFVRDGVEEILNLQPWSGNMAKPYQVKQVRQVILKYKLGGSDVS